MNATVEPLSRFTPSMMSRELLERLFVGRQRTLDAIVARIKGAGRTAERNHTLLVGPRGAGKTHIISLVYHRIQAMRLDGLAVQVAWLPEDAWTIVSYRHLLTAILERLEPVIDEPLPSSTGELEALIAGRAGTAGPIVVLAENLDRILQSLEDRGQQRLRHLLQADRSLLLVATSTRLDRTLSDQARPFYGFFTTTRLEPFDVEQASEMLTLIARERGDEQLATYLSTEQARARLRTIAHLAGGQPRIWALLASALTVAGLAELVELLLTRFDDLTPYYQQQVERLSGQQRLVVAELAEVDHPVNVSDLADRLEIEQRSLAKTISDLVDRGWVSATTSKVAPLLDQRRTYYELAEPLARLSFQIKASRGEPLHLIVEFLKHWFDPVELARVTPDGLALEYVRVAIAGQEQDPVVAVVRRLNRLPVTRAPVVALFAEIDDALAALARGDAEPFLRLQTPVRAALEPELAMSDPTTTRIAIHRSAQEEYGDVPHGTIDAWIRRAEQLVEATTPSHHTDALLLLVDWLAHAWEFDAASEVLVAASGREDADPSATYRTRSRLAHAYESSGDLVRAIALHEQNLGDYVRLLGSEHPATLTARGNLASSYWSAGRTGEAIELEERVLADRERLLGSEHPATLTARGNLANSYQSAGRTGEAIELEERVLADSERLLGSEHPATLTARGNLANSYQSAGRTGEAIELEERVLAETESDENPRSGRRDLGSQAVDDEM